MTLVYLELIFSWTSVEIYDQNTNGRLQHKNPKNIKDNKGNFIIKLHNSNNDKVDNINDYFWALQYLEHFSNFDEEDQSAIFENIIERNWGVYCRWVWYMNKWRGLLPMVELRLVVALMYWLKQTTEQSLISSRKAEKMAATGSSGILHVIGSDPYAQRKTTLQVF